MGFIKHSDGQITSIIKTVELTEEQKKVAQNLSENLVKQDDDKTDASKEKQSEN